MEEIETKEEITTIQEDSPRRIVKKTSAIIPPVQTEHPQKVFEKKKKIFRSHQIIWYIVIFIEVLIFFRAIFKMIGANSSSGFVSLIYGITDILTLPFKGIVGSTISGTYVFEWYLIFAAIVYMLIAAAITYLIQFIKPVTPHEVELQVD